jgi:hypothetical protein
MEVKPKRKSGKRGKRNQYNVMRRVTALPNNKGCAPLLAGARGYSSRFLVAASTSHLDLTPSRLYSSRLNQEFAQVDKEQIHAFVDRCMRAVGCPGEHAATVADILVAADLRGVHSHGVNRLEMYVGEINKGEVDPQIRPEIITETPAIACVNGRNGLGMVVGRYSMELAIKKAKGMGVGWVVARGSNHYGIAGYYAMMAAEQGLVGMSFTNTSPISFPTRSAKHVLGTNPIAVAAPSTDPQGTQSPSSAC